MTSLPASPQASPQESPFHEGEIAVQEKLGTRHVEEWARQIIRDHMPDQHREFFSAQPFMVVAARDANGHPWASLIEGASGFIQSPDPQHLDITPHMHPGDALAGAMAPGCQVGLLGIEPATRRRNRVNGYIEGTDQNKLHFRVGQSFGNCPQYISTRSWHREADHQHGTMSASTALTASQIDWISHADTFFVASGYQGTSEEAASGLDASHRGGVPGFVKVIGGNQLQFPDYAGNNHYNTLGNLVLDARIGLVFVDFDTGGLLQIAGRAEIDWESEAVAAIPGARRLVTVTIEQVRELQGALSLRWTGPAIGELSLQLCRKRMESPQVMSFEFAAPDGRPLPDFTPGQHLPVRLQIDGATVTRSYSLSNSGQNGLYRISVKREDQGLVSSWLHERLQLGDVITASLPNGDFQLPKHADIEHGDRPLVLVGGGIGVTPLVSMFGYLARKGYQGQVWFFHGVRNSMHHAFAAETAAYANTSPHFHRAIYYSRPGHDDRFGREYDRAKRLEAADILEAIGSTDIDALLCGPTGFVADLQTGLEAAGVPAGQILSETF